MALSLSDAPEAGLLIDVEFLLGHDWLVGVILTFERGELVLVANADDDQLLVVDTVGPEKRVAASHQRPWNDAIGRHCLWSWSMPNNTGHVDGAQFLLQRRQKLTLSFSCSSRLLRSRSSKCCSFQ